MLEHNVYLTGGERDGFVVFHDGPLSMEPVTDADLEPIRVDPGSAYASATWSCGLDWYFVRLPNGLALLNVHTNEGVLCHKLSAMFIEAFLSAPPSRKTRKPA